MRRGAGPPLCLGRDDRHALQAVLGVGLAAWVEEQVEGWPHYPRGGRVREDCEVGGGLGRVQILATGAIGSPLPTVGHVDVSIDDYDCLASPFEGGTDVEQGAAFGWLLLVALLLHDGAVPEAHAFSNTTLAGRARCGDSEFGLLRRIGRHAGLRLLPSASFFSFFRLRAWLWHHARLLASGRHLRLCTKWKLSPAHRLAATLEWLAPRLSPSATDASVTSATLPLTTHQVPCRPSLARALACLLALARLRLYSASALRMATCLAITRIAVAARLATCLASRAHNHLARVCGECDAIVDGLHPAWQVGLWEAPSPVTLPPRDGFASRGFRRETCRFLR